MPINTAIRSLEQIKTNGKVTYAWMGVSLKTLTSDIAGMFNMQSQGGALVEAVSPGSPADKAGIKGGDQNVTVQGEQFTIGGDVIVKADNTEIKTADDLIAFLGTKKPGDTVKVTVERDGKTQELCGHAGGASRATSDDHGRRPRRAGSADAPGTGRRSEAVPSHFFG